MKKMATQVNFFCFLILFSVWLAIWCLKISTFVIITVLLKKNQKLVHHELNRRNGKSDDLIYFVGNGQIRYKPNDGFWQYSKPFSGSENVSTDK